tara:strand:- start:424 stop:645 length:222 start_codon:yes stop_codon:yes gene_type:complete
MKIMRVVELNLMAEKERVEYHLEEVINSKDINPSEKIKQIKNTLLELTEVMNSMQLWSSYIQGLNNNKETEEK